MAIKFSNSIYKREHGKAPRGFGRWAFYVPISDSKLTKLECPFEHYETNYGTHKFALIWASTTMTLTEAKNEISKWFNSWFLKGTIYVAD